MMIGNRVLRITGQRYSRPAFTLIEVLVVVAIIALLIAILMPSLAKARELANRAVCSGRLHNMGFAVQQYSQANKGKIIQCHVQPYRNPLPGVPAYGPVVQGNIDPRYALAGQSAKSPSFYVDWQAAAKKYFLDKETWECANRPRSFVYAGTPDKAVQGYTKEELMSKGYIVDNSGEEYDQWTTGYQYFGGIIQWQTPKGNFMSRSPVDSNAKPSWVLAADANLWVDDERWSAASQVAIDRIPPHRAASNIPAGGNNLTFDCAVTWVPFGKMLSIHSWAESSKGGRQGYWWQSDLGDYGRWLAVNDPSHASVKQWKPQ